MTVGELFAGIGGIGLGLERAGMDVKWAIENDPYACAVYRRNFPGVQMIEQDITTVDFTELERVDLLAGGFPCQDISYAGKGVGIEGERSGLWKKFWRAICELRPQLVLVENVPALLSRGLGCVLGDLASVGYDAEWDCIPAAAAGAPHRRDRAFVVAHTRSASKGRLPIGAVEKNPNIRIGSEDVADTDGERLSIGAQSHSEKKQSRLESPRWTNTGGCGGSMADATGPRRGSTRVTGKEIPQPGTLQRFARRNRSKRGIWAVEPNVGRVAHGIPSRVDRLRCLGNAVVPQVAEWIGRRILEVYG